MDRRELRPGTLTGQPPTSYARTSPTTARLSRPSPASTRFTAASMPSSISPPFRVRPSRPTSPLSTTWCRPSTSSRPPNCSRFTIWSGPPARRCLATFNNPPAYVPLDENIPPTPEVVYALAKDLEDWPPAWPLRYSVPEMPVRQRPMARVWAPPPEARMGTVSWNLWSYIDARDGAQIVARALDRRSHRSAVCRRRSGLSRCRDDS